MNVKQVRKKRGLVLMLVITIIAFLVIIVQQMGVASFMEYKHGSSRYHALRAYHAARSGLHLAVFKIILYKHALLLAQNQSLPIPRQKLLPILNTLWQMPLTWPPELPEDMSSLKKDEFIELSEESFFSAVSYSVFIETEEGKLNLNDLASPSLPHREWAQQTLLYLLSNLREKSRWLSEQTSENELRELVDQIRSTVLPLNRSIDDSLKRHFLNFSELLSVEGMTAEILDFIRPYVTLFSGGGLHLQFADKMLIQSLGPQVSETEVQDLLDLIEEDEIYFTGFSEAARIFQQEGLSFMEDIYTQPEESPLGSLIFNFNAPQNFKITSYGSSGEVSRGLSAIIYDPASIFTAFFDTMEKQRRQAAQDANPPEEFKSGSYGSYEMSPFVIHWEPVH